MSQRLLIFLLAASLLTGGAAPGASTRGRFSPAEAARAAHLVAVLRERYHVIVTGYGQAGPDDGGAWRTLTELEWTAEAVWRLALALGGPESFRHLFGGNVRVARWTVAGLRAFAPPGQLALVGDVVLTDYHFEHGRLYALYLTAHEFGHVLDTRRGGRLSQDLVATLGARHCHPHLPMADCTFDVSAAAEPAPGHPREPYARHSPEEYWAEVFAAYVLPDYYARNSRNHRLGARTRAFVINHLLRP